MAHTDGTNGRAYFNDAPVLARRRMLELPVELAQMLQWSLLELFSCAATRDVLRNRTVAGHIPKDGAESTMGNCL